MTELDRFLQEIGVVPVKAPPPPARPCMSKSPGIWYRDGDIPH